MPDTPPGPLSEAAQQFKPGIYQHYRGHRYWATHVARHEGTGEQFVVYRALYGEYSPWIRPLAEFIGEVDYDGRKQPRFCLVQAI